MDTEKLRDLYTAIAPKAHRLRESLMVEFGHLLNGGGVTLGVPLEARVKDWSSIAEKIDRKSLVLDRLTDLDDLIGMRLILLFRRDLPIVDELIKKNLTVRSAEDTALRLSEAQFGYQSQHYVVEIPESWKKLPSFSDLGDLRVEVQVRTLAQHIWAAASHKLQYKHEASVPLPLRRSIHRASALLETVDLEFDRLLQERNAYLGGQLQGEDPDTPLNVEILDAVLSEMLPSQNKGDAETYDDLLLDLNHFEVTTAKKLRQLLKKHMDAILAHDVKHAKQHNRVSNFFFQHVGLARHGLREEFGDKAVNEFMESRRRKSPSPAHKTKAQPKVKV